MALTIIIVAAILVAAATFWTFRSELRAKSSDARSAGLEGQHPAEKQACSCCGTDRSVVQVDYEPVRSPVCLACLARCGDAATDCGVHIARSVGGVLAELDQHTQRTGLHLDDINRALVASELAFFCMHCCDREAFTSVSNVQRVLFMHELADTMANAIASITELEPNHPQYASIRQAMLHGFNKRHLDYAEHDGEYAMRQVAAQVYRYINAVSPAASVDATQLVVAGLMRALPDPLIPAVRATLSGLRRA